MTLEELRAAYPGCPLACEWGERPDTQPAWQFTRERGLSPDTALAAIKQGAVIAVVAPYPNLADMPQERAAFCARLLDEMDHPDFRRYVCAKLGYV